MEMIKKLLPVLGKALVWINPKRVLVLAFFALVAIVLLTVFEERDKVGSLLKPQEYTAPPPDFSVQLSEPVRKRLEATVLRYDNIVAVAVVSANLKINQRANIFYFADDATVNILWSEFMKARGAIQPIFTTDQTNNLHMVSVINGEFSCGPFSEITAAKLVPKLNERIKTVCRVSLPPYYGNFSGYLNLYMSGPIDETQQNELRIELVRLSNDVYRDMIANRTPVNQR